MKRAGHMRRFLASARPADLRFVVSLVLLGMAMRILTKLFGFNRAIALLPRVRQPATARPDAHQQARYRSMIDWARHVAPLLNCLATSSAAWWLLRRRGIPVNMCFGTRRGPGTFSAHAWLEHDGRPLTNEADIDERYVRFEQAIL